MSITPSRITGIDYSPVAGSVRGTGERIASVQYTLNFDDAAVAGAPTTVRIGDEITTIPTGPAERTSMQSVADVVRGSALLEAAKPAADGPITDGQLLIRTKDGPSVVDLEASMGTQDLLSLERVMGRYLLDHRID